MATVDSVADQDICTIQVANLPVDSMELGFQHWYAYKDAVAPDELVQWGIATVELLRETGLCINEVTTCRGRVGRAFGRPQAHL